MCLEEVTKREREKEKQEIQMETRTPCKRLLRQTSGTESWRKRYESTRSCGGAAPAHNQPNPLFERSAALIWTKRPTKTLATESFVLLRGPVRIYERGRLGNGELKTRPRKEREPWQSSEMREATPHRSSSYSGTAVINGAGWCTVRSMLIMARTQRNQAPLAFGQASNPTKSLRLSPSTAPGIRRLEYCSPLSPQKAGRTEW